MLDDKYLANCKVDYAIRSFKLCGKKFDRDHQNFINTILRYTDKKKLYQYLDEYFENKKISEFDPRRVKYRLEELSESFNDPDDWTRHTDRFFSLYPNLFPKYSRLQLELLSKKLKAGNISSEYSKNLQKLAETFKLGSVEQDILTFLFLENHDVKFNDFFDDRNFNFLNISKNLENFCRFFYINAKRLRTLLSKESVLIKAGIIRIVKGLNVLELPHNVAIFLGGVSRDSIADLYVKKINSKSVISMEDHNIPLEVRSIVKNLMMHQGGCNILLYGKPGTGKTEFAKTLAKEVGRNAYFINQADENEEENLDFRKQAIIAAHNIIDNESSILIIDESDNILNIYEGYWTIQIDKKSDRKAWINDFLERTQHKVIWISNKIDGIDESTRRRFSFTMEFKELSFKQRLKVWETQVRKQKIKYLNTEDLKQLAHSLKINSGGITLALKDVQSMKGLSSKNEKIDALKMILSQHQKFTTASKPASLVPKTSKYQLEILNTDTPMEKVLDYCSSFLTEKKKFTQHGIQQINLLLQGPPGTGKTEFVKHLAETLGRELIVKRASDIRTMWYGESVRNIAKAFSEAEAKEAILFFDEADSFFGSRETESSYHAEETNEFLTQMENFKGLLVCATNFTKKMDQASMRRFNYKIKFDYLSDSGKASLFKQFLGNLCNEPEVKWKMDRLKKLQGLTPGDFKVVFQKNVMASKKSFDALLGELESEVSYKQAFSKKVGL